MSDLCDAIFGFQSEQQFGSQIQAQQSAMAQEEYRKYLEGIMQQQTRAYKFKNKCQPEGDIIDAEFTVEINGRKLIDVDHK